MKFLSLFRHTTQSGSLHRITRIGVLMLVTLAWLAVCVPFQPSMPGSTFDPRVPGSSLDGSWVFAMNHAVANGMAFGKEILFTFGPYASVYTQSYHPDVYGLTVMAGLLFALASVTLLLMIAEKKALLWLLIWAALLPGLLWSPDPIFFLYPLMLSVGVYRLTLPESHAEHRATGPVQQTLLGFLFFPLGLLPLIKSSFMPISMLIALSTSLFLAYHGRFRLMASALLTPMIAAVLFWTAAGQDLAHLSLFLHNSLPLIFGYAPAMGLGTKFREIIFFIGPALGLLYALSQRHDVPLPSRSFLILSISFYLFFLLKAGFVRHDEHALIAATGLVFLTLLLNISLKKMSHPLVFFMIGIVSWQLIAARYLGIPITPILEHVEQKYSALLSWDTRVLPQQFEESLRGLQQFNLIPPLEGTVDIYSHEQAALLSSGNTWVPRPVIQSYSAYTSDLAEMNEAHLRSERAPDTLIMRLQPIDGRLPALEDGLSWPTIMKHYRVDHLKNEFLYLKHKKIAMAEKPVFKIRRFKNYRFGEEIVLKNQSPLWFAKFKINTNWWGNLSSLLFTTQRLNIHLTLQDGSTKIYRFIPGMARAGFILSPLVETTEELGKLIGKSNGLSHKVVKSFSIHEESHGFSMWHQHYTLELYSF